MKRLMTNLHLVLVLLIASGSIGAEPSASTRTEGATLSPQQIRADLDHWLDWVRNTHPDPGHSVDMEQLQREVEAIKQTIDRPLDRREIWLSIARLNPLLNDGHLGFPVLADDHKSAVDAGAKAFPLSVEISTDHRLRTRTTAFGIPAGTEIHAINGLPAPGLVDQALQRARGESEVLRRELVSRRFSAFLYSITGSATEYQVTIGDPARRIRLNPEREEGRAPAEERFQYSLLNHRVGYLYVGTFAREHEAEFADFLAIAFQQIQDQGVAELIIDLRDNGGGAHDLSDQLINYLTADRVSPISGVKARVAPENQQLLAGAELGSVVATPYRLWYQPDADNPLRFDGPVYVLIGGFTYSQSIAFSTTVQDHGVALLAGQPTGGRANQTAQVQRLVLPSSGITAVAPLYVMIRASGDRSTGPVQPDVLVPEDPSNANAAIQALLRHILDQRAS